MIKITNPRLPQRPRSAPEKALTLYVGGVHASEEPLLIKTLVGSCIAVCLFDPLPRVGGMNHFMLPRGLSRDIHPDATRFGIQAMDRLIAAMIKHGAERHRLVARVFGGAQVLNLRESESSIPHENIAFIRAYLGEENIRVIFTATPPRAGPSSAASPGRAPSNRCAGSSSAGKRNCSNTGPSRSSLRRNRHDAEDPGSGGR
jgi:chemotaxis receptor (MCP) glutamine deamidase CheD